MPVCKFRIGHSRLEEIALGAQSLRRLLRVGGAGRQDVVSDDLAYRFFLASVSAHLLAPVAEL
jgi:hypothetical protein